MRYAQCQQTTGERWEAREVQLGREGDGRDGGVGDGAQVEGCEEEVAQPQQEDVSELPGALGGLDGGEDADGL